MSSVPRARRAPARARRAVVVVLTLVIATLVGSLVAGQGLIRSANRPVGASPADLQARDVAFRSDTGESVHGWLVPGRPGAAGVLLLHGLKSDRRSMVPRARYLKRLGYTVLLIDLQAHGESPGDHLTFGARESLDVMAASRYLREAVHGRSIGAIGVSLGGAALVLAGPDSELSTVVLESVYSTFEEAVDNRLKMRLGDVGPWLSPLIVRQLPLRLGLSPHDLNPVARIGMLKAPVMVAQGDEDERTTLPQARRLFAAASEPKEFWIVHGAGHVDLYDFDPEAYQARVGAFLARNLN